MQKKNLCLFATLLLSFFGWQSMRAQLSYPYQSITEGTAVTSANDISSGGLYVIQHSSNNYYVYEGTDGKLYLSSAADYRSVVKITKSGQNYTMQSYSGNYWQSLSTSQVTTGSTATTFTLAYRNGAFSVKTSSGNYYLTNNGTSYPKGQTQSSYAWKLVPVTLTEGGVFRMKCRLGYSSSSAYRYLTEDGNGNLVIQPLDNSNNYQYWIVDKSGDVCTLRNLKTGRYIPSTGSTSATEAASFYMKVSDGQSVPVYLTFSNNSSYSGVSCLHHQESGHTLVRWYASDGTNNLASDWELEPSGLTDDEAKAMLNDIYGYVESPATGSYYRLWNGAYSLVMTEEYSSQNLKGMEKDESDYLQVWKVTRNGTGVMLTNAVTGRILQANNGNWSTYYATGTGSKYFTMADGGDGWLYTFYLKDGGNYGPHCAASQGNYVVKWTTDNAASTWAFEEVTVDEAALAAAKAEFEEITDMQENAAAYTTALSNFFTDGACTTLKSPYNGYSDNQLTNALANQGITNSAIQGMAMKVKNASWETYVNGWDKTEATYRIADYNAYNEPTAWTDVINPGHTYGRLTSPTGIYAHRGDVLQVYVGSIPAGETVKIEIAGATEAAGRLTTLAEGFNVVLADQDGNVYVNYLVDNTSMTRRLDDYPAVTVHIEGGDVNGYFDLTKGYTNTDWDRPQRRNADGRRDLQLQDREPRLQPAHRHGRQQRAHQHHRAADHLERRHRSQGE